LLRHLRKEGIGVPVIVITGKSDAVLKDKVLQAGAMAMLHKPVDGVELITLIEGLFADKA
jgi:FixJ family two-component response regulator